VHHIYMAHIGVSFACVQASIEHMFNFILGKWLKGRFRGVIIAQPAQTGVYILGGDLAELLISDYKILPISHSRAKQKTIAIRLWFYQVAGPRFELGTFGL
jgi:hypothetical protein